ncbi:hypothetical protein FAI40_10045 [Acetobacteraceae bacterium]|nr:hypothetical protein FAI40_10045 [Acetobacteraceae bacterium]
MFDANVAFSQTSISEYKYVDHVRGSWTQTFDSIGTPSLRFVLPFNKGYLLISFVDSRVDGIFINLDGGFSYDYLNPKGEDVIFHFRNGRNISIKLKNTAYLKAVSFEAGSCMPRGECLASSQLATLFHESELSFISQGDRALILEGDGMQEAFQKFREAIDPKTNPKYFEFLQSKKWMNKKGNFKFAPLK